MDSQKILIACYPQRTYSPLCRPTTTVLRFFMPSTKIRPGWLPPSLRHQHRHRRGRLAGPDRRNGSGRTRSRRSGRDGERVEDVLGMMEVRIHSCRAARNWSSTAADLNPSLTRSGTWISKPVHIFARTLSFSNAPQTDAIHKEPSQRQGLPRHVFQSNSPGTGIRPSSLQGGGDVAWGEDAAQNDSAEAHGIWLFHDST